jgi:hypothetical protein
LPSVVASFFRADVSKGDTHVDASGKLAKDESSILSTSI